MSQFEFDGARYNYDSNGPRTSSQHPPDSISALLLMPQSTGPAGTSAFVDSLSNQYRVTQYQQLDASHNSEAVDMQRLGQQASALLEVLDSKAQHLVCHSTGCGIGLWLAATQPERVASLVLITPWTHADAHLHALQTLRQTVARTLDNEQYERFNSALLFPPAYRREHEKGFAERALKAASTPRDVDTFIARLDAILAFDARRLWSDVHCPTLVIGAEDDQLMPVWFSEETAGGIKQAELLIVKNGGHMLPETRGADVADSILAFLANIPPR